MTVPCHGRADIFTTSLCIELSTYTYLRSCVVTGLLPWVLNVNAFSDLKSDYSRPTDWQWVVWDSHNGLVSIPKQRHLACLWVYDLWSKNTYLILIIRSSWLIGLLTSPCRQPMSDFWKLVILLLLLEIPNTTNTNCNKTTKLPNQRN